MTSSTDGEYIKNRTPIRLKPNEMPVEIKVWTKGDLNEILE
jgi:hypothetical protein